MMENKNLKYFGLLLIGLLLFSCQDFDEPEFSNYPLDPPPPEYMPLLESESLYLPFEGDYKDMLTGLEATTIGTPGFVGEARVGSDAYSGNDASYLTFPTSGLLESEFSATMWYKVNDTPDRAGILVIGPPDPDNPDAANVRTSGFRLFRENAGGLQRIKLNVGNGSADSWFDGGAAADIDPTANEWSHIAFTISGSECVVYINGVVVSQGSFSGVDWTGCDIISIMSGAPRFSGWGHLSDSSYMDDLRLYNASLTQGEILNVMSQGSKIFNMSFDDDYIDTVSGIAATEVGSPGFAGEANEGTDAYAGEEGSYLTFPTDDLGLLGSEFSATMWYKVNDTPDRAGILVIGPPDPDNPDAANVRTSGFRLFRENAGGLQRIKLNVGNGSADSWFDGGAAADIDPTANEWSHIAFTISGSECVVYINGVVVSQGAFSGVDWTGCDIISIMSGAPRFSGWGHLSDSSYMDELQIFDRALTSEEIQSMN